MSDWETSIIHLFACAFFMITPSILYWEMGWPAEIGLLIMVVGCGWILGHLARNGVSR